jgi:hypothetical protein
MSEQYQPEAANPAAAANGRTRVGVLDLVAFLGVLVFVGGLALLVDRSGQLSGRLAFAGAAGLVAGCVTAWRRLRRPEPRRWRSGQAVYRGRRVTVVSAWGVEGQPLPAIDLPAAAPKKAEGGQSTAALPR